MDASSKVWKVYVIAYSDLVVSIVRCYLKISVGLIQVTYLKGLESKNLTLILDNFNRVKNHSLKKALLV